MNPTTNHDSLQAQLDAMERRNKEKLEAMEKKQDEDIKNILASVQSQLDSTIDSIQERVERSHREITNLVKEQQEKLSMQMSELIKIVNLFTAEVLGDNDHVMKESRDATGLRPILAETQMKKRAKEAITHVSSSARESKGRDEPVSLGERKTSGAQEAVETPEAITQIDINKEATSPHTSKGAYNVLHLWE